ncbi:expressed protein, partial [Phakopsora pachyrhizi]
MPQATTNVDSQPLAQVYNQLGENGLHLRSSFFRLSNSRSPSQFDHKSFPEFGCRSENSAAYFLEAEEPKHWNNLMVPKDSAERDDHKFDLSLDSKVKNKQKIPAENFKSHGSTDYNKYLVNKAADTDLKLSFHGYSQAHEFKPGAIVIDSPLTLNKKHDFQIYSNYLGEDTLSPLINAQEPPSNRSFNNKIKSAQEKGPKHSRDRYFKRVHKRKSTEEYSSSKRVFETVEDKRSSYPADPIRKPYFDVGPTNEKNIAVKNHELFKNALMELLQPKNFPLQLNLLTGYINDVMKINDQQSKDSILKSFTLINQQFAIIGNKKFHVRNKQVSAFLQLPKAASFKFIPRKITQLRNVKHLTTSCANLKLKLSTMDFGNIIKQYLLT